MSEEQPSLPLTPPPEVYSIPRQIIDRWTGVQPEAYVTINLTRQDLDHLFFGFTKCLQAQGALQACIIEWSHGRIDPANVALSRAQALLTESQNEWRKLFTAIMSSAQEVGGHDG